MNTKKFTILHSNDIHGDFLAEVADGKGDLIGGLSLLSGYINKVREEEENVLYIISGDMVQGSLIDLEYKGISTMEIMNYLAPDVVSLGNHELDYGHGEYVRRDDCAGYCHRKIPRSRGLPRSSRSDRARCHVQYAGIAQKAKQEAAKKAATEGIRIIAIGLGDENQGSRIPIIGPDGQSTFLQYKGQEVWSKVDGDTLREIVYATEGGKYLSVKPGTTLDLGEIYEDLITSAKKRELESATMMTYDEKFQIFVALGIALIICEALVSERKKT